MTIRVVVADDQTLVRGGFRLMLELEEDIRVVAVNCTVCFVGA